MEVSLGVSLWESWGSYSGFTVGILGELQRCHCGNPGEATARRQGLSRIASRAWVRSHRGRRRHVDERMQRIELAALHEHEAVPRREGGDHLEPQVGREQQLVLLGVCIEGR